MAEYRKKPIVIAAWQWLPDDLEKSGEIVAILAMHNIVFQVNTEKGIDLPTLEGTMTANRGDWIIRGVNGEFYPCKSDIFEKTYEEVW